MDSFTGAAKETEGVETDNATSQRQVSSRFVSFDGYLGAIGAFMNEFNEEV